MGRVIFEGISTVAIRFLTKGQPLINTLIQTSNHSLKHIKSFIKTNVT